MTGLFVAFEGGEGVGKSTQIAHAAAWAREQGRVVLETREPGGTPLGVELRRLVLDPDGQVTPRAEALLYAADRAHHVDTVVGAGAGAGRGRADRPLHRLDVRLPGRGPRSGRPRGDRRGPPAGWCRT